VRRGPADGLLLAKGGLVVDRVAPVAGRCLGELVGALWGGELDMEAARALRRLFVKGVTPCRLGLGEDDVEAWRNLAYALGRVVLEGAGVEPGDARCEVVADASYDCGRVMLVWWPRGVGSCPGVVFWARWLDGRFLRFRSLGKVEEWLRAAVDEASSALAAAGWFMPAVRVSGVAGRRVG